MQIQSSPNAPCTDNAKSAAAERYESFLEDASLALLRNVVPANLAVADGVFRDASREISRRATERYFQQCLNDVHRGQSTSGRRRLVLFTIAGLITLVTRTVRVGTRRADASRVLGLRDRGRTVAVERALCDFGVEESFARAADRFTEHYGFRMSRWSLRKVTLEHGKRAEEHTNAKLASSPPPSLPVAKTMLFELDGTTVRTGKYAVMKGRGRTRTGRRKRRRDIEYRLAKTGLVRPLDDAQATSTYVAKLAGDEEVAKDLERAALHRGHAPATDSVAVLDGGNGLHERLEERIPGLICILDRCHLSHNFYETAHAMKLSADRAAAWVEPLLLQIDAGLVLDVIKTLDAYIGKGKKRVQRLRGYLYRFQYAVNYDEAKAAGYPIGSGAIESAHKFIHHKRLRVSGATWDCENVNPILALRALRENGEWKNLWKFAA